MQETDGEHFLHLEPNTPEVFATSPVIFSSVTAL